MGRFAKFLIFGVLGLVAAFVVVAILAILLIDPNDYRDDIELAVKESTGRDLDIQGDLRLGFFPWISIDVGAATLGNREGFGAEPMVKLGSASLALKLLPIFSGNVEVGDVKIDGAVVRLAVDKQGANNWEDIGEDSTATVEVSAKTETVGSLSVAGISLTNSAVYYSDAQAGTSYTLEDLELVSGAIVPGELVPVSAGFRFTSEPDALGGTVRFESQISLDTENGLTDLRDINLTAELSGLAENTVQAGMEADSMQVVSANDTFEVAGLVGTLGDLTFRTSLSGSGLEAAKPVASGPFTVDRFSPKRVMGDLGLEVPATEKSGALTRMEITGKLNVTGDNFELSDATVKLDDTTFTGSLGMIATDIPTYTFSLAGDAMNADDYLEPVDESLSPEAYAAATDATEIPADTISTMNAKGTVKLAAAIFNDLDFTDVVLGVNLKDKRLRLNPLSANLYGGNYSGDVRIDARGKKPKLSVNENVNNVQLGPLAKKMFETENLSGTIAGKFVLTGSGDTVGAIRKTLNGNIRFELTDGALEGKDIWYQIRRARALFKAQPAPEPPANPRTEFSAVSGSGTVKDGVLSNNDFKGALPFLQLTGRGTVDLGQNMIDYNLTNRVLERPEFLEGATPEELDEYTEAVIPMKIKGPLTDPSITLDVAALARAQVKSKIDKKKDELKDRLLDKLGLKKKEPAEEATDAAEPAEGEAPAEEEPEDPEEALKQKARDKLRDLFGD